ncbi:MAG: hypothetical protein JWP87_3324, partial [Labilithrix sp.]|nr:hypothetical protein [Labilithrix sp.]
RRRDGPHRRAEACGQAEEDHLRTPGDLKTAMRTGAFRRGSIVLASALALSLATATTAHAAGVEPAKATPVQREQAQSRFLKGRELYNAKKYDAALAELTASLDIVASPNTRLYVGRCLRDMGRTVAAYAELGRAAVEAKELLRDDARYEKAAQAANDERAQLAPKLGFVDVKVAHPSPETTLKVASDEVRRGGWEEPVPVVPGTAEVVVETPGHAPIRQQVQVAAGEHKSVEIDAAATVADTTPPPVVDADTSGSPSKLRPVAYVTAGVAVVGLATFFIAGSMSNSTFSDLKEACGSGPCPKGHEDDISAGKTQQTFANVGLVVFAVAAAATVTLYVVSAPKKTSSTTAASARVTAGPSFVGLQGAF